MKGTDEEMAQAAIPAVVKMPGGNNNEKTNVNDKKKFRKGILLLSVVLVIIVAATLIGVLVPKHKGNKSPNNLIAPDDDEPSDDTKTSESLDDLIAPNDQEPAANETNTTESLDDLIAPNDQEPANETNTTESLDDLIAPDDQEPANETNTTTPKIEYFEDEDAPIPFKVPLYSSENIGVYSDEEEAQSAFENFGSFLVSNNALERLAYGGFNGGGSFDVTTDQMFAASPGANFRGDDGDVAEAVADTSSTSQSQGSVGNTADAFETNNQEETVDQADVAKSDGTFIYAAFSDYLLIFRATTEELVLRLPMPEIEQDEEDCSGPVFPVLYEEDEPVDMVVIDEEPVVIDEEPVVIDEEPVLEEVMVERDEDIEGDEVDIEPARVSSSFIAPPGCHYKPKPYIQALLLSENRLAVVVSGYGYTRRNGMAERPVLWDFLSAHLRLYDTTELDNGELPLLGVQDINGYYNEGFVVGDVAHVVTTSGLNTYDWLVGPAQRFDPTEPDFEEQLRMDATNNFVPRFAESLIEELSITTGSLPNISMLNMMVDGLSGVPGFEEALLRNEILNSMVQITSFNMVEESFQRSLVEEPELDVSITCQFLGSHWNQAYATDDMIIVAGQGSRFDSSIQASEEATFLFGFSLDGVQTTPETSGVVPGSILSPYSIDYQDGYLRIATTIRNRVFVDTLVAEPMPVTRPANVFAVTDTSDMDAIDTLLTNSETESVSTTSQQNSGSSQSVAPPADEIGVGVVMEDEEFLGLVEVVDECPEIDDECMLDETLAICQKKFDEPCKELFYSPSLACPYKFDCLDKYDTTSCPSPTDPGMTFDNFLECNTLVNAGCTNINILETSPLQFRCGDDIEISPPLLPPAPPIVESTTENQIYVLTKEDGSNDLQIVGNVTLGKPNEWFTAVRFFDHIAYAVTFQQTDPFYVIDFPTKDTPRVLGELNITGFSRYLHPINTANNLILGVGQEADEETGRTTGLQISLFNAEDPINPTLINRIVFEHQWASSAAEWDEKAFRYLKLSDEHGRLIIPISYTSSVDGSYFDGFSIFAVTINDGVSHLFDISHNEDKDLCYYCGYLAQRSFVVDGDVITLKGRSARSHDLDSGDFVWGLDFAWESDNCCNW